MAARAETLAKVVADTGAVEIHPFDDPRVQAGQGTATLELLDAVPAIGMVVAPVSGGGLLSGTAIAAHGADPALPVWGAEPEAVDDAYRSLAAGRLVLDGAGGHDRRRPRRPAQRADARHPPGGAGAGGDRGGGRDRGGHAAPRADAKQIVEPSGAVALAGLARLARDGVPLPSDVGVIVSGGNVDLDRWLELTAGFGDVPDNP